MSSSIPKLRGKNQIAVYEALLAGHKTCEAIEEYTGLTKVQIGRVIGSFFQKGLVITAVTSEVALVVELDDLAVDHERDLTETIENIDEYVDLAFKQEEYEYTPECADDAVVEQQIENIILGVTKSVMGYVLNSGLREVLKKVHADYHKNFFAGFGEKLFDKVLGSSILRVQSKLLDIRSRLRDPVIAVLESQYSRGVTKEDIQREKREGEERRARERREAKEREEQQKREEERREQETRKNTSNSSTLFQVQEKERLAAIFGYKLTGNDKRDYKKMIQKAHPDRNGGSEELAKQVNSAFGK